MVAIEIHIIIIVTIVKCAVMKIMEMPERNAAIVSIKCNLMTPLCYLKSCVS